MSERQDFSSTRTDRPSLGALVTVAEVLELPAVRAGAPEVVVGGAALDAEVRWAHSSDSADVARLLDGGELLLTTGAGWPAGPKELGAFVHGLHRAGVAGIVLELGASHATVPDAVADACAETELALIALASEVKFVAVTEAVHRALIAAQTDALRERQRLHELFTALSLRGAPADVVVAETARAIGAPVVLRNLAHEVIAIEGLREPVADVLARLVEDGEVVPVEARGVRWGVLSALPGPAHPAGRLTVLEQGATALAFGCLAVGGDAEWTMLAHGGLVDDLLGARFANPDDVAARLAAGGFTFTDRRCHGIVAVGTASASDIAQRARSSGCAVVAASVDGDDVVLLAVPESTPLTDDLLARIVGPDRAIFVGPAARDVLGLLASVRAAGDLASSDRAPAGTVRRVEDRPLERLVAELRDDRRLHEHSERMLAPLVAHDRDRRGDLLAVLTALVAHPGNRSAAAAASHLSRSVFYQRLTLIADLLGADLDDGETLAALHLALSAHRTLS